jgi:hypothetical protein
MGLKRVLSLSKTVLDRILLLVILDSLFCSNYSFVPVNIFFLRKKQRKHK